MHRQFSPILALLILWSISTNGCQLSFSPAATDAQQPSIARFPGSIAGASVNLDGSAVCSSHGNVYLSTRDRLQWSELAVNASLPNRAATIHPVGGDRERLYFITSNDDAENSLAVYDVATSKAKFLRKLPSELAAFASRDVGAISTGQNLNLTADGGETWNPTPPIIDAEGRELSALLWISKSRLLVNGTDGSLQLLERDGNAKLRKIWGKGAKKSLENVRHLTLDGDFVWAWGEGVRPQRIKLSDGQLDAPIEIDANLSCLSACHGHLLLAGTKGDPVDAAFSGGEMDYEIADWMAKEGTKYERGSAFKTTEEIAAILQWTPPKCIVITASGKGFVLNLDKQKLEPQDLQITPLPPPPPNPNIANMDQLRTVAQLLHELPRDQGNAILRESRTKTELTKKQQADWVIEQLQRAIAENKKAGIPPPAPPK